MKKQKVYYHTFDLGKRKITLCAYFHIDVVYYLGVGMSVCVPEDAYNEQRGHDMARAKVIRNPKIMFMCSPDQVDGHVIKGILAGVEKSIRRKPGKYIAGYKKKSKAKTA